MNKQVNKFKKIIIPITLVVLAVAGGLFGYGLYNYNLKAVNSNDESMIEFTIESGESTGDIIDKLEEADFIRSAFIAKIYLKFHPIIIQAGTYNLSKSMTLKEILGSLMEAEDETVWVTIPEGLRIEEIAEIWVDEIGKTFNKQEFKNLTETTYQSKENAEGYLFPDTYNVPEDADAEYVFDLMTETFNEKVGVISYDTLILASIVEREARNTNERTIVAGILQKRLNNDWLLQADATLLYMINNWKGTIDDTVKATDSEFNTYKYLGLPPTPICNPGLSAINAARNPEVSTPYWFYLHDSQGNIHYARNETEHIQNIYDYL